MNIEKEDNLDEVNASKLVSETNVSKYSLAVWFSFTEQYEDHQDGQVYYRFDEVVGFKTVGFDKEKDAIAFKDKIWIKGFPLQDNVGKDWARVLRVRIVNNELVNKFKEGNE